MSWAELVEDLRVRGYLSSERVVVAMKAVDRSGFVDDDRFDAAVDRPLPIGSNQTISAPHMAAMMTEALEVSPEDTVLEVGTGSGFQAAVLAELAGDVVTVERIEELYEIASERLEGYNNVMVVHGDGGTGYPAEAPYDRIIVTAAADELCESWEDQLVEGGRLLVPLGDGYGHELAVFEKEDGELKRIRSEGRVRFVPLKEGVEE